jgi:hypothetical protein
MQNPYNQRPSATLQLACLLSLSPSFELYYEAALEYFRRTFIIVFIACGAGSRPQVCAHPFLNLELEPCART